MIYRIHVNTFWFLVYYFHVLLINFELSYSRRGRPHSSRERNRFVRNTLSSQAKVGPPINVGDRQEERGRARRKERGWIGGGGREERLLDGSRSVSRGRGRGGVSRERGGGGRERKRGSLSRESERGGGGSIERGSSVNIRAGSFDLQDDRDTDRDHDDKQGSINITRNRDSNRNRERERGIYRATSSERGSSRGSAVRPDGRNGNGLGEHLHGISRPKVRVSDSMSTAGTNNNNNNNGDYDNINNYNGNSGSGGRNRDSHRGEMHPELSYFIQPAIRSHFSDSKKEGSSIKKSHSGGSVSALSWKSSGQKSVQNSRAQDPVYGEKELEKLRDCLSNHPQLKKEKEREAVRSGKDKEKDKLRHKDGGATRYTDIQKINSKIQSTKSNDEFDITKDLESVGLGPSPVPPPSDRVVDVYARGTGTYFKNLFARSQSPSLTRGRGVGVGTGVGVVRDGERDKERERERSVSPMSSQNVSNMSSNKMRENVRRLADAQRACVVSPPAARNERRHYD